MESNLPFFTLKGTVVHGKGLGRTVGLPTANIKSENSVDALKRGVYSTLIYIDHRKFMSVTNVGTRPSVDDSDEITIETNIIDFDEDIYDKTVKLEFYYFIRGISKFASLEDVKKQVDKDKAYTVGVLRCF